MTPDVISVINRLYVDLGTPVALKCFLLVKHQEWDQLASCRVDPRHYTDTVSGTERFKRDYQAASLLRKCADLPNKTTSQREAAALAAFLETERKCRATNDYLFRYLYPDFSFSKHDEAFASFLRRVRGLITRVLGKVPDTVRGKFGKGAIYESRGLGRPIVLADKMSIQPHSTPECAAYWDPLCKGNAWERALLSGGGGQSALYLVRGDRFTTVEKDSEKDRGITVQPGFNLFAQLGAGNQIRRRIKKILGIDIRTAQGLHRSLVRKASLDGLLATIDLSSASDLICWVLVKLVLPDDWYSFLNDIRCHYTEVTDPATGLRKWVRLEKFSASGNGFTFELETLIFYAIVSVATGRDDVKVYGDDILVHAPSGPVALKALQACGFVINEKKTFLSGPFKESCGSDFFDGVDVRPHHIEKLPTQPNEWISLANAFTRASGGVLGRGPYRRAWISALANIPAAVRNTCVGPAHLGDLLIHDTVSRWKYEVRGSRRWFRVWRPVHRRVSLSRYDPDTAMACALYGVPSTGMIPRNAVSGYRFGRMSFS